jgi:hypothetical protein
MEIDDFFIEQYEQYEQDKPIIRQIENILEEEESYYSVDMILKELFNKFNISKDVIKEVIKSDHVKKEKCKRCYYTTEYTFGKHISRCNSCNHINFCKECYQIIRNDWKNKFNRRNNIDKIINCKSCNEQLHVDICKECNSYSCICGCPCECTCLKN